MLVKAGEGRCWWGQDMGKARVRSRVYCSDIMLSNQKPFIVYDKRELQDIYRRQGGYMSKYG